MIVGVGKETAAGERRVAVTPDAVKTLAKAQLEVAVERGAGEAAGFRDDLYEKAGARVVGTGPDVYASADVVLASLADVTLADLGLSGVAPRGRPGA